MHGTLRVYYFYKKYHISHGCEYASDFDFLFQGGLVSVCDNCSLHIWSIRQKQPALIQSLNFKKEKYIYILY